jgi:UDP-glucose 4-epimerase
MKILVTGSAGHLGEALMRTLAQQGHEAIGVDRLRSAFTHHVGSIVDRAFVRSCMGGIDAVLHAATLHKPHVATHPQQAFIDVNLSGTLNLLEEAADAGVRAFVFTSTTSTFGRSMNPPDGAPAVWVTEALPPVPKNIYGVTKVAAENLCELAHRDRGLPCIVLRTSRFFPEGDDEPATRHAYADANAKLNEFLFRRVDIEDVVDAHLRALERAAAIGFGRYIISATTPFTESDLAPLRVDAAAVLRRHVPEFEDDYRQRGWSLFPSIDRVYVNELARTQLGWAPRWDFRRVLERLRVSQDHRSALAQLVGAKGYHAT